MADGQDRQKPESGRSCFDVPSGWTSLLDDARLLLARRVGGETALSRDGEGMCSVALLLQAEAEAILKAELQTEFLFSVTNSTAVTTI